MVSINTNLSSLIVQNNLQKSTNAINQAIECMTTGFKINHAADNAAGYSISQNMSSQISSYGVAQDNIAMGLDMVTTAQDSISLMQSHAERIMALWNQAQNGTYGEQSLQAIQSEVNARMDEIERLYSMTEYNGISLFEGIKLPDWAKEVQSKAGNIQQNYTYNQVSDVDSFVEGVTYTISTVDDLARLAELVNNGDIARNVTFVLESDLDLASYCAAHADDGGWTPIGTVDSHFDGTFIGNGHTISNLMINRPDNDCQGLFGVAASHSVIKDVRLEGVNVSGYKAVGGLVGVSNGTIESSYSTGTVSGGNSDVGGLVGGSDGTIESCYSTGNVSGQVNVGGLVGYSGGTVESSYSTGTVNGVSPLNVSEVDSFVGGEVYAISTVDDLAALAELVNDGAVTQNVTFVLESDLDLASYCAAHVDDGGWTPIGTDYNRFDGTFIGNGHTISNLTITRPDSDYQGLFGFAAHYSVIKGVGLVGVNVSGLQQVGGLVGHLDGRIESSYSTGTVSGIQTVGGMVGGSSGGTIEASYSTGTVNGQAVVGGLVGGSNIGTIEASYSTGTVNGDAYVDGLIGYSGGDTVESSYSTGTVNGISPLNVSEVDSFVSGETYTISTVDDLARLAELVNNGDIARNVTFVLESDLDLASYCAAHAHDGGWTPIGRVDSHFDGTFIGNGHTISNLMINRPDNDCQGLFGVAESHSFIKGVRLEGVNVSGLNEVGGLVGHSVGKIESSYSKGTVNGNVGVGGLVGHSVGKIESSYSKGIVSGNRDVGGLVGYSGGTVESSYSTCKFIIQARQSDFIEGAVYSISTVDDLVNLAEIVNNGANTQGVTFILESDLDLASYCAAHADDGGWTPIGNDRNAFDGTFIGNGHTISNLTINRPDSDCQGLFGVAASHSVIKGVRLEGVNVSGLNEVGGLVGHSVGKIESSYSKGTVNGNVRVGGLVGVSDGSIESSYSTVTVSGQEGVGGLVGILDGIIESSYSTGTVSGNVSVGGIIGQNHHGSANNVAYNKTANPDLDAIGYGEEATNVTELIGRDPTTILQIGIKGDSSNQIFFSSGFTLKLDVSDIKATTAYASIKSFLDLMNEKATELGAVSNRLESALESTSVAVENIVSSRSTLRDADIAKESSNYIKSQILQQAAATLLATANQSPSIALQLI